MAQGGNAARAPLPGLAPRRGAAGVVDIPHHVHPGSTPRRAPLSLPPVSDARWRRRQRGSPARTTGCRTSGAGRRFWTASASCPRCTKSTLRLYYRLGASVGDIAELLDTPEKTVKSYMHRADGCSTPNSPSKPFDA